jgi:hypothetical protein
MGLQEADLFMRRNSLASLIFLLPVATLGQTSGLAVQPGLSIPNAKTPWALDHFQGQDQLVPIHHSNVDVNGHTGANIAGALTKSFFYKPKWSVDLEGVHSSCHLHVGKPTFYVHSDEEESTSADSAKGTTYEWAVVRAHIDKDHRVFTQTRVNQLNHKTTRESDIIPATLTRLDNGWMRIALDQQLEVGEYAVMQIPASPKFFSERVFDFGLDPSSANVTDSVVAK